MRKSRSTSTGDESSLQWKTRMTRMTTRERKQRNNWRTRGGEERKSTPNSIINCEAIAEINASIMRRELDRESRKFQRDADERRSEEKPKRNTLSTSFGLTCKITKSPACILKYLEDPSINRSLTHWGPSSGTRRYT